MELKDVDRRCASVRVLGTLNKINGVGSFYCLFRAIKRTDTICPLDQFLFQRANIWSGLKRIRLFFYDALKDIRDSGLGNF